MSSIFVKKTTIHNVRRLGRFLMAALVPACLISTMCLLSAVYTPTAYAAGRGQVVLTIEQALTGGDLFSRQNQAFSYRLTAIAGAPLPGGSNAQSYVFTIKGTTDAKVDTITYRMAGTYEYELDCVIGSDDSVQSFDRQVYTISVYVTKDLSAFVVIGKDNGDKAAQIMFAHTLVNQQEIQPPVDPPPITPDSTPEPTPEPTPAQETASTPTPAPVPIPVPLPGTVITTPVIDDTPTDEGDTSDPNEQTINDEIEGEEDDALINEPDFMIEEIEDDVIPLGSLDIIESWSLMNLIFTAAGIVLTIMIGIRSLINRKREKKDTEQYGAPYSDDNKNKRCGRPAFILAIPIFALGAIVIFLLTQDIMLPMVIIDWWTLAHAILLTCGLLSYIFAYTRDKDIDGEQPASHTGAA